MDNKLDQNESLSIMVMILVISTLDGKYQTSSWLLQFCCVNLVLHTEEIFDNEVNVVFSCLV